jgi:hypothetical protein
MNKLKAKLKNDVSTAIAWVTSMEYREERFPLSLDIDEDSTPYVKSIDKDYSLLEKLYFEDCQYIFSVSLEDYGWDLGGNDEGELTKEINQNGDTLSYEISDVESEKCEVTLKGHIFTEIMSATYNSPVAELKYFALKTDVYKTLKIHEVLALEAFHLEEKGDYKLSLFTYFTAIEALVSQFLDDYKNKLHEELHYPLEHLELDKKIRIIIREAFPGTDFKSIPIWGDFTNIFKLAKSTRNNIAHASNINVVTSEDSFNAYYALIVLRAMLYHTVTNFNDVRKIIYPKNNKALNHRSSDNK